MPDVSLSSKKQQLKKAKWKVVPDMAKFKGYFSECAMVTVLAVSEQREPTDSENPTQEIDGIDPLTLYYRGPFYLDIDSDKIDNSIKSTRKLVTKLKALGVDDNDIQLWATGKKRVPYPHRPGRVRWAQKTTGTSPDLWADGQRGVCRKPRYEHLLRWQGADVAHSEYPAGRQRQV